MNQTFKMFDAAEFLDNDEVIAAYLQDALEDEDPDVFLLAVADVVKARSMTRVAEASGLGRESLYKALRPGAKPGFATMDKLLGALGVRFQVAPLKPSRPQKPGKRETPAKSTAGSALLKKRKAAAAGPSTKKRAAA
ncbi:addiction module antidote protein [Dyella sp. RRB7]|uniref:addiction module antidote protein n=1 Tax=Dyella sp. RRB7 TaxID=2919502 RepID=UPI001FAAF5C4|nr:addiction module antidote protein [Dyella sp. RRB7]